MMDELQKQLEALIKNPTPGLSNAKSEGTAGGTFSAFEAMAGLQTSSVDKDQLKELKESNIYLKIQAEIAKEQRENSKKQGIIGKQNQVDNNNGFITIQG